MDDAQAQLDGFIDKFSPEIAALTRSLLSRMTARLPGATIMVYDNYNALAIGFGAGERPNQAVLSLAVYPKRVNLCFLWGKGLPDPHGLLQGDGSRVRHIRLPTPETLDDPRILGLIDEAVARSEAPFDPAGEPRVVVRMALAKQRPRRPVAVA